MKSKCLLHISVILAVLLSAVSCSEPDSQEMFISASKVGSDGLYHFPVDFSDSLAVSYDISFFSRVDCNRIKISDAKDFPMLVTWESPSGLKYGEKVYFGLHESSHGSDFYSSQYRMLYRKDIVPVQKGVWELTVRVDNPDGLRGLRGLGLIVKRNRENGTQEADQVR